MSWKKGFDKVRKTGNERLIAGRIYFTLPALHARF
jgi:hypothetical protein